MTLEQLGAAIERIEKRLDALARPAPKLLSRRAAARMLGVDRGTTLAALVRTGRLRLVLGKVPLDDLERVLAEGVPDRPTRRRREAPKDEAPDIRKAAV